MPVSTLVDGNVITAAGLNANFALCVLTDTAKTITVTHTYTASQTFTGGWTAGAACTISTGGLTVTSNDITMTTAFGLVVGVTRVVTLTATGVTFNSGVTAGSTITASVNTSTNMLLVQNNNGAGAYPIVVQDFATAGDSRLVEFRTEAGAGTARGSIDFNRGGTAVRYNTTSDATLKNVLGDAPVTKSVGILRGTRLREYSWKGDPTQKRQIGVIAQELYETFKGAVSVGGMMPQPDRVEYDDDGKEISRTPQPDAYVPWGVDKTAFQFHLIAGWQDHERRLAALEGA